MTSSKSTTPVLNDPETSISLNDNESIKKQEPKKQVNIVISYIEQNDEQGIGQSVKLFIKFNQNLVAKFFFGIF